MEYTAGPRTVLNINNENLNQQIDWRKNRNISDIFIKYEELKQEQNICDVGERWETKTENLFPQQLRWHT